MAERYFDYNATTPIDRETAKWMIEHLELFGNPSSKHTYGEKAKGAVVSARSSAARALSALPEEIVITSGGSESNNYAIKGWLSQFFGRPGHIVTTCMEHPSVLQVVQHLERRHGFSATYLPVNKEGFVSVEDFRKALRPDTQLATVMFANNELGTIQPIREMAEEAKRRHLFFHSDAVQAVGKVPISLRELGVDALSFSAHKFNGPKGVGGLFIRSGIELEPLIHGGGQEGGARSGTENVVSVVGMGKAFDVLSEKLYEANEKSRRLKGLLIRELSELTNCSLNGSTDPSRTLANTVNVCFHDVRGEALAAQLSMLYGIAISVGSACSANKETKLSHVLRAIGLSEDQIKSSVRISFGPETTEEDVRFLAEAVKERVASLRLMLPVGIE
ncbi:cysteine desulfurase family protein [Paenibacillus sp. GCM10027627]|uniref:cysteine desulfurase family protein n=1 Tax=unclassified Paenibacillus TaxID=185978 RepID=UPI00362FCB7C